MASGRRLTLTSSSPFGPIDMQQAQLEHAPSFAASEWPGDLAPAALAVTFVAQVVGGSDADGYLLHAGARPCRAPRAASCLLEPRPGDRVACWRVASDDLDAAPAVFIVAVLSRADAGAASRLSAAGDIEIAAPSGSLRLVAHERVGVSAGECQIEVENELRVRSGSARLIANSIDSISAVCSATIGQLKLVGAMFSTVFERETHHAQHHSRSVDGVDRLDAQIIDHQARELMHLQGENVLANGARLVKVRGSQIHFG
jgi:hypothetical protein